MCNSSPLITDWIMVVITAVYAITTICILLANRTSAKATKMQLEEMKRQFEAENQPYITTEVIYEKRCFFGLRFTNHGKKIAENVTFDFDRQFVDCLKGEFKSLIEKQKGKACVIGIGQHHDIYYGGNDILGQELAPAKGIISYTSCGKKYTTEFEIDLYNYMTHYAVNSFEEDLLKTIKEQNTEIRRIKETLNRMAIQNQLDDNGGQEEA